MLNLTQATEFIKKHEYTLSFLVILLVVTISNISAVFGLDVLFQDDYARYNSFVSGQYKVDDSRSLIGLGLYLKWIVMYILGTYSAELARLFIVLAVMVPASCLFYYFNRKYLQLSVWISLLSAVIINAIPRQFFIPTFLDGSYPTYGMLFFVISLIITARYLNATRYNTFLLITATVAWLLVCDLVGEMGIFLFPVLLYFIYSSNITFKKKLPIYLTTSIITSYKLYTYFQSIGAVNKPTELPFTVITNRIVHSVQWWLPYGGRAEAIWAIWAIVATTMAYIAYTYIKSRNTATNKNKATNAYVFYAIWYLSCSFPFWFLSKFFGPRYLYISYYALTVIALISLYFLISKLPKPYKIIISTISIVLIFTLYAGKRNASNTAYFNVMNKQNDIIYALFSNEKINDDTQIALVNIDNGTGGFHIWSSGYLQYMFRKPGVKGVMGREMNFYDPFNLNHCRYSNRMSCLNTNKELIAFKQVSKNQIIRMEYFLQWRKKSDPESEWNLYHTDKENRLSLVSNGTGFDSYLSTLSETNIEPEQVLWGNSNDKKSLEVLLKKTR